MPAQKINKKANAELERCANEQQNEGGGTAAAVALAFTYAEEISIARAINRLYKMVPNAVTKRECVVEVLPIRARDDKCPPVRELPAHERHARAEPRVPVNVFHPADVVRAVDEESSVERLPLDAGDEVAACKPREKSE
jgi:hypothetical protein